MKTKRDYIKIVAYVSFAYFIIGLLGNLYLLTIPEFRQTVGILNIIFNPLLLLLGGVCSYFLLKKQRWALIAITTIISWQIAVSFYLMTLGIGKLPLIQVAYLALLINAFRFIGGKK
jgi:hypothetical protein